MQTSEAYNGLGVRGGMNLGLHGGYVKLVSENEEVKAGLLFFLLKKQSGAMFFIWKKRR